MFACVDAISFDNPSHSSRLTSPAHFLLVVLIESSDRRKFSSSLIRLLGTSNLRSPGKLRASLVRRLRL